MEIKDTQHVTNITILLALSCDSIKWGVFINAVMSLRVAHES